MYISLESFSILPGTTFVPAFFYSFARERHGSMQPKSVDMFELHMACRLNVLWSLHGMGLRQLKFDSRVRVKVLCAWWGRCQPKQVPQYTDSLNPDGNPVAVVMLYRGSGTVLETLVGDEAPTALVESNSAAAVLAFPAESPTAPAEASSATAVVALPAL